MLADAPPTESFEGAREALEARGRAEELLQVLADGAAPSPLLLAEAPAERAPCPTRAPESRSQAPLRAHTRAVGGWREGST